MGAWEKPVRYAVVQTRRERGTASPGRPSGRPASPFVQFGLSLIFAFGFTRCPSGLGLPLVLGWNPITGPGMERTLKPGAVLVSEDPAPGTCPQSPESARCPRKGTFACSSKPLAKVFSEHPDLNSFPKERLLRAGRHLCFCLSSIGSTVKGDGPRGGLESTCSN